MFFLKNLKRIKLNPISRVFGLDRGQAIDRYYIENFLERHACDIQGRVLEIGEDIYTKKFGNDVVCSDVLHAVSGNPQATIIADLAKGDNIASNSFEAPETTCFRPY